MTSTNDTYDRDRERQEVRLVFDDGHYRYDLFRDDFPEGVTIEYHVAGELIHESGGDGDV